MPYIIPSVHPANALRGRPITQTIAMDLAKAWRIAQTGEPDYYGTVITVLPSSPWGLVRSFQAAVAWMRHWRARRCPVSVDVETSSLDYFNCKLYSLALSGVDGEHTAIAFSLINYHTIPYEYECALFAEAQALLYDPQVPKIFHNSPFDRAVLYRKGMPVYGDTIDTQGLHHLVQPDIPHDLGWVGQTYLDCRPWKVDHEGKKLAYSRNAEELLFYNGEDALNTGLAVEPLLGDLKDRGAPQKLISAQMAFADLATDMELYGLPIDMAKRRAMGMELLKKIFGAEHSMREFLDWPDFNPMSDAHRREALFGPKYAREPWNLGIRPTRFTEKQSLPSTSYKAIIDHLEHPLVRSLATYVEARHTYATQYRECADLEAKKFRGLGLSKQAQDALDDEKRPGAYQRAMFEDGRLHAKWNPTGQKGSRFSSSPNVQNIKFPKDPTDPKGKRKLSYITAPDGRVFVAADKDQLELRIAACRAGVRPLLAEMEREGGDPHRLAAMNVYGEKFLQRAVEEQKRLRNMVKNVVYAALYMAGVMTVWRTIRERKELDPAVRAAMTVPVVNHIYHGYFGLYPEFQRYHEAKIPLVERQGYIEIPPLDRRRYFPVLPAPFCELANWDIQTIGSDIVGTEMCCIQNELKRRYHGRASVILHCHDQVVVECDARDGEDVKRLVDQIFGNTPLEGPAGMVHLTAKAKIGRDLASVK